MRVLRHYCMTVFNFPLFFFSGLLWAAKVSISFILNFLKGVRIYVLAQVARKKAYFASKYGGKWAG